MVLYHGAQFFLLLLAGALLAILWRGSTHWLNSRLRIPFKVALPVIVILHMGLLVLFFWLAAPNIAEQVAQIREQLPTLIAEAKDQLQRTALGKQILAGIEGHSLQDIGAQRIFNVFSGTLNVVVDVLLILVFALFLTADPQTYRRGILLLVPAKNHHRAEALLIQLDTTLFRWFIGKILDMFSIFVMTVLGLWLLDMPLIFTLAFIAFLFSFVPNVGPLISVVPAAAIALLQGPQQVLYVCLLYLGIQLFESYFVTPNVQKHASYVPPVLLLLVQFLLARFLGVLGLFLSTPLLVILMIVVRKLYIEAYVEKDGTASIPS